MENHNYKKQKHFDIFLNNASLVNSMKKGEKLQGNFAYDFLKYLDEQFIKNKFAKEVKHFRGSIGGYFAGIGPKGDSGINSIYRLSENPEIGLRVLSQRDYGYNEDPDNWAFVKMFLVPWDKVKNLKNNSKLDFSGEEIDGGTYLATSKETFKPYKRFEDLKDEMMYDFKKNAFKKKSSKTIDTLLSIGITSLFLIGSYILITSSGFTLITGNVINSSESFWKSFIGIYLIFLGAFLLFFKFNSGKNKSKRKLRKLQRV